MIDQNKKYDLEERTSLFAERVRNFCLRLPKNVANAEYLPQLIRAGSSPGAITLKQMKVLETRISK